MHIPVLWKANIIAFISSFCVMVIELVAARILAPYIGVSLYTWTSIIGIILAGIALGNYIGGKIADRYASPGVLMMIFFTGAVMTFLILPATNFFASAEWFYNLPLMLNFVLKTACIFFIPAIILSMVSPTVIKLTLADLGKTGGVVGTIYACSTAGSILGTFMTGFYFIIWFGTRTTVWLIAIVLIITGILAFISWTTQNRWKLSSRNLVIWSLAVILLVVSFSLFEFKEHWQEDYTKESNYYTIKVKDGEGNIKILVLDHLIHSYNIPGNPTFLKYDYCKIFRELTGYFVKEKPVPRILHLGGGGYSFPQYLQAVYPESINEVVEIDEAVTQVAHEELGLSQDTSIITYNQDARLFLIRQQATEKYDVVIGDVFNDLSTPYHLTTLEFNELVKANMTEDGIYLINIVDDYRDGRYMPSMIYTLKHTFDHVYLFGPLHNWEKARTGTYVLAATDQGINISDYQTFITKGGKEEAVGRLHNEAALEEYLIKRNPLLLTDDCAPTDILVLSIMREQS